MQLKPAILPNSSMPTKSKSRSRCASIGSPEASAEIRAYIAARDLALAEAERQPSDRTLDRAFLANQLVGDCLRPARSLYEAQCLPEAEAIRERQRCETTGARIAQLRAGATRQRFRRAVAA